MFILDDIIFSYFRLRSVMRGLGSEPFFYEVTAVRVSCGVGGCVVCLSKDLM